MFEFFDDRKGGQFHLRAMSGGLEGLFSSAVEIRKLSSALPVEVGKEGSFT
jgi:hypothetical protein